MQEYEVVDIIHEFVESKFPKVCQNCGRQFDSLADYLKSTTHHGKPVSYDAEEGDWTPKEPIGTLSLSDCKCGSTLCIDSKGMNVITLWRLMHWARKESKRRGIDLRCLLEEIREKVDSRALGTEYR